MRDISSSNKRVARNTVFLYLRMIVVLLVSLYTTRVVLNVLGVVDYGIYNVVAGFVSMFAFMNTSMINATQRFYSFEYGANNEDGLCCVYNASLRIQVFLAIVTLVLLETIGLWYINNKMVIPHDRVMAANWVFQFSVLSLIAIILQIPYSAAVIAHEKMDFYAIVSIIEAFLKLCVALALPFVLTEKLITYGFLIFVISLVIMLCNGLYAKIKFEEIRIVRIVDKDYLREMLGFSGWNVLESISYLLQGQGLNMLMNVFWGPVVNAARSIAYQIQGAISGFSVNIATAFRPQLVESYAELDFKRTERLMFSMTKFGYLMLFIISLPICLEIQQLLDIWLKGTIPDYTIPFTILMLVNMLINSFNMPLTQTVLATGKVRKYQLIRSIINASPLLFAWWFIRLGYGPTVVFMVTIVVSVFNQVVSMALLHQVFRFSYRSYLEFVVKPCFLFSLVTPLLPLLTFLLFPQGLPRLIAICVLSVVVSLLSSYVLVLDKEEKELIGFIWMERFKFCKLFNRK